MMVITRIWCVYMNKFLISLSLTFAVSLSLACSEKPVSRVAAVFDPNQPTTKLDLDDPHCSGISQVFSQHGFGTAVAISPSKWLTNSHVLGNCETKHCKDPLTLEGQRLELIKRRDSYDYAILAAPAERGSYWEPIAYQRTSRAYLILKDENGTGCHRSMTMDVSELEENGIPAFGYRINTLPGNSGAPLFNEDGNLIGIHAGVLPDRSANFSIPISLILNNLDLDPVSEFKDILDSFETHGTRQSKRDLLRIVEESRGDCNTLGLLRQHLDASKKRADLVKYFQISKKLSLDHLIQEICQT